MNIAFRTDASLQIGTGHVMRCLTLAEELRVYGGKCTFYCRPHAGNLIDFIRQHGFNVLSMGPPKIDYIESETTGYSAWLGSDWLDDAQKILELFGSSKVDRLVVDHYAIDERWEKMLRPSCSKLMVIDDLANRPHCCDLLLDQGLGRSERDYEALLNSEAKLLTGLKYALIRREFFELREYSLSRRVNPQLDTLLIAMGGVDQRNVTAQVLNALKSCRLNEELRITVILGKNAPWIDQVRAVATTMPWATNVSSGVNNIAQIMAESDLAIGAAGGMAWERCVLGLPTLIFILAENQKRNTEALHAHHACIWIQDTKELIGVVNRLSAMPFGRSELLALSQSSSQLVNGDGTRHVAAELLACHE